MPRTAQIRAVASFSRSRLDSYGAVDDQVDGGGIVAALGPGPLPALGVDRLGRADLAQQLVGAALVQQGQQLLPGGQLEQVNQPAGTVTQQHGPPEARGWKGAGDGLAGGPGVGSSDPIAPGAVARPPQRPGELGTAPELEGRADRHLVGGLAFLAGELVDPRIADHLEPLRRVEQEGGSARARWAARPSTARSRTP